MANTKEKRRKKKVRENDKSESGRTGNIYGGGVIKNSKSTSPDSRELPIETRVMFSSF